MFAKVKLYATGAAVFLTVAVVLALAWRWHIIDQEKARVAAEAARDFRSTIERIEDADVSEGDADDDLRWLSDRLHKANGR